MFYRVLKEAEFSTQTGDVVKKVPGEIVEILTSDDAERLLADGVIGLRENSCRSSAAKGSPAATYAKTVRVGFWINTSSWYSGGRIHMYQFALSLARSGAEVFIVTDGIPRWQKDYPECNSLSVVIIGSDKIPSDLDVVITDAKGMFGEQALKYREQHPYSRLICFNFETPNWVESFCPDYAKALSQKSSVFEKADMLMANSRESAIWLNRWLGRKDDAPVEVLYPAVNTHALGKARDISMPGRDRPYAVWSSRSPAYKGGDVAIEAIKALPMPFDLVMIGQPKNLPGETKNHRFIPMELASDVDKYALMRGAACVLAPSKFEGCGMVPMEAMSCGTPVVVYDLPVLREVYGDSLVYAKWGDREDFKRLVAETVQKRLSADAVDQSRSASDGQRHATQFGLEAMQAKADTFPYLSVKTKRLSVHMVAYWGFVPEALESVYPYADEILVAYGRVPHAQVIDDGTLERLRAFPDPDGKIRIEARDVWQGGKKEMRQWCVDRMTGNYHLLLDGDEIWTGMDKWMAAEFPFGCPRWINLWHSPAHYVRDYDGRTDRWGKPVAGGGSVCPHYRWSWLRRSYHFATHPTMVDQNGQRLHIISDVAALKVPGCAIYHLGHALPAQVMSAKHDFYLSRDGADEGRRRRKAAWHEWNGTLGDCGDGIIEAVNWQVPEIVQRAYERISTWQVKA